MNYKIASLILSGSNIDAHLEDDAGYSVVVPIEYNKVYHYLSINLGYDKDDVYDNLSFNVDIYKEELSLLISTNYHNTVTELFTQARIDEVEHEQQLVNVKSMTRQEGMNKALDGIEKALDKMLDILNSNHSEQSFNHTENNF